MAAGHCVCKKTRPATRPGEFFCLTSSKNQIVQGKNEIDIYGGGKSLYTMIQPVYKYHWKAEEAYIMGGSSVNEFDKFDMGIIKIPDVRPFFDKKALKEINVVNLADIIPVCLAALNYELERETLIGLGWGSQYDESPGESYGNRLSIYSSCMTSEAGPQEWRFKNCDMKEIERNGWECEKQKPPPSYKTGESLKCKRYFWEANVHKTPLKTQEMKDIEIMHITGGTMAKEICYNPKLLRERGWCKLAHQEYENVVSWGICSSSCDSKYMKVSIS